MSEALAIVDDAEQAAALLDPTRRSILEALREPASAAGLAQQLSLPRQRLNYHLHELERAGLVELQHERQRGSVRERIYRRTSERYAISVDVLGALGVRPEQVQDRFSSAYQVALASQAIADLAVLRAGADAAGQPLATWSAEVEVRFADARARAAFADELAAALAALVQKHHDATAPAGRTFKLYLGAYPKPKRGGDG